MKYLLEGVWNGMMFVKSHFLLMNLLEEKCNMVVKYFYNCLYLQYVKFSIGLSSEKLNVELRRNKLNIENSSS